MSLNGTYSVLSDSGAPAGTLTVTESGLHTHFRFEGDLVPAVSRLMATAAGRTVSLGIPVPEAGRLRLDRTMSRTQLRAMTLTEIGQVLLLPLTAPLPESAPPAEKTPEAPTEEGPRAASPAEPEETEQPPAPADGGEGWRREPDPGRLFTDPAVAALCRSVAGALVREEDGQTQLAIPVHESGAFPLTSFLCLGTPATIGGAPYVVFTVKNGAPV